MGFAGFFACMSSVCKGLAIDEMRRRDNNNAWTITKRRTKVKRTHGNLLQGNPKTKLEVEEEKETKGSFRNKIALYTDQVSIFLVENL